MRSAGRSFAHGLALILSIGCQGDGGDPAAHGSESGSTGAASEGSEDGTGADTMPTGDIEIDTGETESETDGDWASLAERPCPDDSFLTFENFGAMHLLNYCTGCHASGLPAGERQMAPIEINFDDLEAIRAHADRIWARAGDANATMPPAGSAPDEQRTWLGEWLACGAPTDADLASD